MGDPLHRAAEIVGESNKGGVRGGQVGPRRRHLRLGQSQSPPQPADQPVVTGHELLENHRAGADEPNGTQIVADIEHTRIQCRADQAADAAPVHHAPCLVREFAPTDAGNHNNQGQGTGQ